MATTLWTVDPGTGQTVDTAVAAVIPSGQTQTSITLTITELLDGWVYCEGAPSAAHGAGVPRRLPMRHFETGNTSAFATTPGTYDIWVGARGALGSFDQVTRRADRHRRRAEPGGWIHQLPPGSQFLGVAPLTPLHLHRTSAPTGGGPSRSG